MTVHIIQQGTYKAYNHKTLQHLKTTKLALGTVYINI
jgi:hypothetical protein